MLIIGISGVAGSGKDTVADIFLKNNGFERVSLADPIKRLAKELWGFSDTQLWGPSEERSKPDTRYNGLTPRRVLQHLGTEGGRAIDEDVWIRYAVNNINKELSQKGACYKPNLGFYKSPDSNDIKAVVISDVRFINEIRFLKKEGGALIRVKRPGAGLEGKFGMHQSEVEMSAISDSEFDFILTNDGTLEDLEREANIILNKILSAVK